MDSAFWQHIRETDYAIPDGMAITDLTPELLAFLGSPDPLLRDTFGYGILATWIERGAFSHDQLRGLAMQMVANLSSGLGEHETDSVFLRSFSALILSEIVAYDNATPFLREAEVRNLLRWALEYLHAERDLRGYADDKGWIHATAHTADLLRALARSRFLLEADLERILISIADKITTPTAYLYNYNEDERLVLAVWSALQRKLLTKLFLASFLARCVQVMHLVEPDAPFDPHIHAACQNTRGVLRSLYFRIAFAKVAADYKDLRPKVLAAVKAVSR